MILPFKILITAIVSIVSLWTLIIAMEEWFNDYLPGQHHLLEKRIVNGLWLVLIWSVCLSGIVFPAWLVWK